MANSFYLRCERIRLRQQFNISNAFDSWASDLPFEAGSLIPTVGWNAVGQPILQLASFGFKMRDGVFPMTCHRLESISVEKPSQTFLEGRCLVPVDVFCEPSVRRNGASITASYGASTGRMLALAALIRPELGGLSVTILTIAASATVGNPNGRMPAILGEDDYDMWLDETTDAKAAIELIRTPRDDLLVERPFEIIATTGADFRDPGIAKAL